MKNKIIILIAAAFVILGLTAPMVSNYVYAEEQAEKKADIDPQITPVSQRVILRAKEVSEHSFTVKNNGTKDFSFTVYSAPFSVSDENYTANFSKEGNRTQISRWIAFKQTDGNFAEKAKYSVAAGQKLEITYKVSAPDSVPAGGQYATIFTEVDSSDIQANANGVKPIPRLSLIIYGRSEGDTKQEAEISDYKVPGFIIDKNISATALVKNHGNTDLNAVQEFQITTLFGKKIHDDKISYPIFPDQPRRLNVEFKKVNGKDFKPVFGVYKVTYSITAHDKTIKTTTIVVAMSSFFAIIALILLTILIAWLIITIKQRKERSSRQMV